MTLSLSSLKDFLTGLKYILHAFVRYTVRGIGTLVMGRRKEMKRLLLCHLHKYRTERPLERTYRPGNHATLLVWAEAGVELLGNGLERHVVQLKTRICDLIISAGDTDII